MFNYLLVLGTVYLVNRSSISFDDSSIYWPTTTGKVFYTLEEDNEQKQPITLSFVGEKHAINASLTVPKDSLLKYEYSSGDNITLQYNPKNPKDVRIKYVRW